MKLLIVSLVSFATVICLLLLLSKREKGEELDHSSKPTSLSYPFESSPVDDHDDLLPSKNTRPRVTKENAHTYYSGSYEIGKARQGFFSTPPEDVINREGFFDLWVCAEEVIAIRWLMEQPYTEERDRLAASAAAFVFSHGRWKDGRRYLDLVQDEALRGQSHRYFDEIERAHRIRAEMTGDDRPPEEWATELSRLGDH